MRATFGILTLVVAAAVAATPAAPSTDRVASVRLLDRSPLTVRGTGFVARERVRVTVTVDHAMKRVVRATAAGTFTATFADMTVDRCSAVRVVAIGGNGSRATLKILPSPACPPD